MNDQERKISGLSPSVLWMDELNTPDVNELIKENINLRNQNLQLRRANSRLKSRGRRLTRIIIAYKEKLTGKQKTKFRNKNHQGRRR